MSALSPINPRLSRLYDLKPAQSGPDPENPADGILDEIRTPGFPGGFWFFSASASDSHYSPSLTSVRPGFILFNRGKKKNRLTFRFGGAKTRRRSHFQKR